MKVMKKESILEKDHAQYVWSERDCLTSLKHPYIVQLYFSFQVSHGGAFAFSDRAVADQAQAVLDSGVSHRGAFVLSALSEGRPRMRREVCEWVWTCRDALRSSRHDSTPPS